MRSILIAALAFVGLAAPAQATTAGAPTRVQLTDDGPVLVTPEGMTLYTFTADDASPGKSACTAKVIAEFPDPTAGFGIYKLPGARLIKSCIDVNVPFRAGADAQAVGDWTLVDRTDGAKQWAYRTRPLYTSARDTKPGDHNGLWAGQAARRGMRLALAPPDFPPGLDLVRYGDQLVLASGGRPLFTGRGARIQQAALGVGNTDFRPLASPAMAMVGNDWSAVSAGPGRQQYAFKGKPLFVAPDGMTSFDVLDSGDWEMIVYHRTAPPPKAVATRYSPILGDIYVNREGRTLYVFSCGNPSSAIGAPGCDAPGGPAGYWAALCGSGEECSRRWRPYLAAAGSKPSGEWSVVEVSDPMFTDPSAGTYPPGTPRVKAWAYRGRPVYTFYEDHAPGDIWGHMVRWFGLSGFSAITVPGKEFTP
jgi:predicted lipoprotein with Yx(FWY)xxD motif